MQITRTFSLIPRELIEVSDTISDFLNPAEVVKWRKSFREILPYNNADLSLVFPQFVLFILQEYQGMTKDTDDSIYSIAIDSFVILMKKLAQNIDPSEKEWQEVIEKSKKAEKESGGTEWMFARVAGESHLRGASWSMACSCLMLPAWMKNMIEKDSLAVYRCADYFWNLLSVVPSTYTNFREEEKAPFTHR